MNPKVDFFFNKNSTWQKEYDLLRSIILECGLTEELKWGKPCYTLNGNNVVLIHGFKDYCAILFHKGVLLNDDDGILIQQTKNVQVARQLRFTSVHQISEMKSIIKAYIFEAIDIEQAGLEVELKKTTEFEVAEEFQEKLDEISELKTAFENLTPGRQRGYLLYFSNAKQSKTRTTRVEKCIPDIFDGKGLND